jgi:hypothetical protein
MNDNALVSVGPSRREPETGARQPFARADFITHLIATAAHLPQMRERRRVEPAEAVAAYRILGQWPSEVGRTLAKSL